MLVEGTSRRGYGMASGLFELVEMKSAGSRNQSVFAAKRSYEIPSGCKWESGKIVKGG